MSVALTTEAIQRGIDHLKSEIADTQAQIKAGKHPEYDGNCRRYIAECRAAIRRNEADKERLSK